MRSLVALALLIVVCVTIEPTHAWENYELDLFDLVEELNENFYDFFGVKADADAAEIRKMYRKLSMQWHPDRNSDPDAERRFRLIVAVNDVLKDEVKRARYDQVLEHGLPDWRQPIYYFRRARKLSTTELAVSISIIISVGHYFVMWAQHFERKLTLEDRLDDIRKKVEKKKSKKRACADLDEIDEQLQHAYDTLAKPTLAKTLPWRLTCWMCHMVLALPGILMARLKQSKQVTERDNVSSDDDNDDNVARDKEAAKRLSGKAAAALLNPTRIEKSEIPVLTSTSTNSNNAKSTVTPTTTTSSEWTDREKCELIKAIARFPAGSVGRWQSIADQVATRTAAQCIQQEKLMKASISSTSHSTLNANTTLCNKDNKEMSRNENEDKDEKDFWSQQQQDLLEKALKETNKDTVNRWDVIAAQVPNKSKDQCINRFKALCAAAKMKK